MNLGLAGRTALVCGGSRGIGRAIASRLAEEGAQVAICARNGAALRETARAIAVATGPEVVAIEADLANPPAARALFEEATARLGRIDILVNNCGGPPVVTLAELGPETWTPALQAGLLSAVQLIQLAVPGMAERGWGRILNIGSTTIQEPTEALLLSSTIRPALAAFSKAIAARLAPRNVLVHTLCPGPTDTDRMRNLVRSLAEKNGMSPAEAERTLTQNVPMARLGAASEIADVAACLLSDRLSFCTGLCLRVDGGQVRSWS
ncbi:MAG TPA: SDR family oxidoreductase [Polyangia bacterium]|nr:SDR family oxidoreductase [Polyangia bacterium]